MMADQWGEWKIWNGGECPVASETVVQVQLADETRIDVDFNRLDGRCGMQKAAIWCWRVNVPMASSVANGKS